MLKIEGINLTEIDRFLVGTAVLLNGRSVEIGPRVKADLSLNVQNSRTIPQDHSGNTGGDHETAHLLLDGNLRVLASVSNQREDGLVGVASDFIDWRQAQSDFSHAVGDQASLWNSQAISETGAEFRYQPFPSCILANNQFNRLPAHNCSREKF